MFRHVGVSFEFLQFLFHRFHLVESLNQFLFINSIKVLSVSAHGP